MPLVQVMTSREISGSEISDLVEAIPHVVARNLNVPGVDGGQLSTKEIDVVIRNNGMFDMVSAECAVVIWANEFPERKANLEERTKNIVRELKGQLQPGILFYVWIMLAPAAFWMEKT